MNIFMKKITFTVFLISAFCFAAFAQAEVLFNKDIILMTRAGLSRDLIVRKISETDGKYDTSAESLIELKKAGVADEVIKLMLDAKIDKAKADVEVTGYSDSVTISVDTTDKIYVTPVYSTTETTARIVLDPKEALKNAKTIAIKKSSLQPSRQALEKELLKCKDWNDLNLNIVRYREDADLLIEIGYVSLSWITHRYVYRIYDNKSGTVIAAGETTSWGSLSENLARGISKKLSEAVERK